MPHKFGVKISPPKFEKWEPKGTVKQAIFGDKFGESLVGGHAPPSFLGTPQTSPEVPRTSPKFSATSPEVLSLWNLTAIRRFPGSLPNFPGSSPKFPGSSGTSPEVSPFLWEAWHPLLTHKNFLWNFWRFTPFGGCGLSGCSKCYDHKTETAFRTFKCCNRHGKKKREVPNAIISQTEIYTIQNWSLEMR